MSDKLEQLMKESLAEQEANERQKAEAQAKEVQATALRKSIKSTFERAYDLVQQRFAAVDPDGRVYEVAGTAGLLSVSVRPKGHINFEFRPIQDGTNRFEVKANFKLGPRGGNQSGVLKFNGPGHEEADAQAAADELMRIIENCIG
jgi:hypothetical protein